MSHVPKESITISDGKDAEDLCMPHLDAFADNHVNGLFPAASPEEEIEHWRLDMKAYMKNAIGSLAQDGNLSVIRLNGEVAGIAGHEMAGHMPDGRSAYEIMRVSVLREFRKKDLHIELMNHVFRQLREAHASSPLLIHSKAPSIKSWAEKAGFRILSLRDYATIKKFTMPKERMDQWVRDQEEASWCSYVFDPKENNGAADRD